MSATSKAILNVIEQRLHDPTAAGLTLAIKSAVDDGQLPAGTKLPPIRTMASELALSPTTVSASWATLTRWGLLRPDGRRGTTVLDRAVGTCTRYHSALEWRTGQGTDLSTGVPDADLLPNLGRALSDIRNAGTPTSYLDAPVLPELIDWLRDDWPWVAADLLVVDGAMDALDLLVHTQIGFGGSVVVEHPVFTPLVDVLESIGANIVPVPLDEEGLNRHDLLAALNRDSGRVRTVILQPRAQNPTGISMSRQRAQALAEICADNNVLVIEDDSANAVAATPPLSLGEWFPAGTVHVRSFSKSHGPDLRLAAMGGPADVISAVRARRGLGQGWSSRLLQRVLMSLLTDPHAHREVQAARETYARRRNALVAALDCRGVHVGGTDGINIWIPVADEATALVQLAAEGVVVAPGRAFILLPEYPDHIRVTAGLVPEEDAEAIADILATAALSCRWGHPRR